MGAGVLFHVGASSLPSIVDCRPDRRNRPRPVRGADPHLRHGHDQQAATIGQGCIRPRHQGYVWNRGLVLSNTGDQPFHLANRLLTTFLCQPPAAASMPPGSARCRQPDAMAALTCGSPECVGERGAGAVVPAMAASIWFLPCRAWAHRIDRRRAKSAASVLPLLGAHLVRAALESRRIRPTPPQAFEADGESEVLRIDGGMVATIGSPRTPPTC
jgi:hypothetical protein